MEMEKETRSRESISIGQDITPPLPPLSIALHDFVLPSLCSACFSSFYSSDNYRRATDHRTATRPSVVYCSTKCESSDSPLHFSSAEHQLLNLLRRRPSIWPHGDSSDLRASLRLIRRLELLNLLPTPLPLPLPPRIAGLMTNRDRLTSSTEEESKSMNDDTLSRLKDGARAMAMARAMRDGREFDGDCELEEAVMCIVVTNAVEVQIGKGMSLGIAVYDCRFSWINHSCSPNACYRFALCSGDDSESSDSSSLRIVPASAKGIQMEDEEEEDSVYGMCELATGRGNYGPRLVVRSIKAMKRGDQVTVTYMDLMQLRKLRRSCLWFKYRFSCRCIRCNAVPLSYVDRALQETFYVDLHLSKKRSVSGDRSVEEMVDYFDSLISEYTSPDNMYTKTCWEFEKSLIGGLLTGYLYPEKPSVTDFRLSPIHHLSLNAYLALYFAYQSKSSFHEYYPKAYNMRRISTAYSLLLAGATHHLFTSNPSLIASAANFWTNAGESLVCLARRSPNSFTYDSFVCDDCLLMDMFEDDFSSSVAEHEELNKVSQHFLQCVTSITPKVWNFLAQNCGYLEEIEDPINFSWLESLRASNVWKYPTRSSLGGSCYSIIRNGEQGLTDEVSTNIFLLGAHCLMYGCYLSGVCYGQGSAAANGARNILYVS